MEDPKQPLEEEKRRSFSITNLSPWIVLPVAFLVVVGFLGYRSYATKQVKDKSLSSNRFLRTADYKENQPSVTVLYTKILDELKKLNQNVASRKNEELEKKVVELTEVVKTLKKLNPYLILEEVKRQALPRKEDFKRPYKWAEKPLTLSLKGMELLVQAERGIPIDTLSPAQQSIYTELALKVNNPCCPAPIKDCGCKHGVAMKGLIKILLKEGYSPDAILAESRLWQSYFFPETYVKKEIQRRKEAGDKDIESLLQKLPSLLPKMQGGC